MLTAAQQEFLAGKADLPVAERFGQATGLDAGDDAWVAAGHAGLVANLIGAKIICGPGRPALSGPFFTDLHGDEIHAHVTCPAGHPHGGVVQDKAAGMETVTSRA